MGAVPLSDHDVALLSIAEATDMQLTCGDIKALRERSRQALHCTCVAPRFDVVTAAGWTYRQFCCGCGRPSELERATLLERWPEDKPPPGYTFRVQPARVDIDVPGGSLMWWWGFGDNGGIPDKDVARHAHAVRHAAWLWDLQEATTTARAIATRMVEYKGSGWWEAPRGVFPGQTIEFKSAPCATHSVATAPSERTVLTSLKCYGEGSAVGAQAKLVTRSMAAEAGRKCARAMIDAAAGHMPVYLFASRRDYVTADAINALLDVGWKFRSNDVMQHPDAQGQLRIVTSVSLMRGKPGRKAIWAVGMTPEMEQVLEPEMARGSRVLEVVDGAVVDRAEKHQKKVTTSRQDFLDYLKNIECGLSTSFTREYIGVDHAVGSDQTWIAMVAGLVPQDARFVVMVETGGRVADDVLCTLRAKGHRVLHGYVKTSEAVALERLPVHPSDINEADVVIVVGPSYARILKNRRGQCYSIDREKPGAKFYDQPGTVTLKVNGETITPSPGMFAKVAPGYAVSAGSMVATTDDGVVPASTKGWRDDPYQVAARRLTDAALRGPVLLVGEGPERDRAIAALKSLGWELKHGYLCHYPLTAERYAVVLAGKPEDINTKLGCPYASVWVAGASADAINAALLVTLGQPFEVHGGDVCPVVASPRGGSLRDYEAWALDLPGVGQARVAREGNKLLETLETEPTSLSPEWTAEVSSRIAQLERGEVKAVPWTEVEARIRRTLGQGCDVLAVTEDAMVALKDHCNGTVSDPVFRSEAERQIWARAYERALVRAKKPTAEPPEACPDRVESEPLRLPPAYAHAPGELDALPVTTLPEGWNAESEPSGFTPSSLKSAITRWHDDALAEMIKVR